MAMRAKAFPRVFQRRQFGEVMAVVIDRVGSRIWSTNAASRSFAKLTRLCHRYGFFVKHTDDPSFHI